MQIIEAGRNRVHIARSIIANRWRECLSCSEKSNMGWSAGKFCMNCFLWSALMFCGVSRAETGVSRDWIWNTDAKDFYFAITTNSAKQILGQYCYIGEGTCFYIVSLDVACEPGSTYPAIVNSDKGADHIVLRCVHEYQGHNILGIYEFDKVDELVREASHIGIAVPMENDQFEVIRFSLIGSSDAIDHMRNAAKSVIETHAPPETEKLPAKEVM